MLDGGQALWVGRVGVARPAALGTLGLGLWADGAAGLKHVASLELKLTLLTWMLVVLVRYSSITPRSGMLPDGCRSGSGGYFGVDRAQCCCRREAGCVSRAQD